MPLLLKPFLPQLQRTFVKSLSEAGATVQTRAETVKCLGLLIPLQPRLDPLVAELMSGIKTVDDTEILLAMWNALNSVVSASIQNGKSNLSEQSLQGINNLMLDNLKGGENDGEKRKCAANCFGTLCSILAIDESNKLIR